MSFYNAGIWGVYLNLCVIFFFSEKYMIWVLMEVSLCNVVIGNLHLCSIVC